MMSDPRKIMRRYQNLMVGEALSNSHLYPFVCNELSSILILGYSRLPKTLKAFIFRDTLSAFRLLPEVESVLPKQKKNLAVVELKQAKVALKRCSKSHEEDIDLPSLPQDILIHIFSFLDVTSLLSSSQVSRSWNQATSDVSLWKSQFDRHFNHKVLIRIQSGIDWREAFKKAFIVDDNSSKLLRTGRGYCSYCDSIVWHDNLRCPNKHYRLNPGDKPLDPMSTHQVVNYLLGIMSSRDESDSDDETVLGLWAHPTLY